MPYNVMFMEKAIQQAIARADRLRYLPIAPLRVDVYVTKEPVEFSERKTGVFLENLQPQNVWGELFDCAWFHFTGRVPVDLPEGEPVLLIDIGGELCLFDDAGVPTQGLTSVSTQSSYIMQHHCKRVVWKKQFARPDGSIDLWADAGANDLLGSYAGGIIREASIGIARKEMNAVWYDFCVLYDLMQNIDKDMARYAEILHTLYRAARTLGETDASAKAARKILNSALSKHGATPSLSLTAIGHAHIDLAWLWPLRETYRKGARTFATALRMMERYPAYRFGASQPQLYQWIKDKYPGLYAQVKQRVTEGRWEVQGAAWVEPDMNIPSGESIVRQLLYGKLFFKQEFGIDVRTLWLPDVFGYNGALPQILNKAGVDGFVTIKLAYNHHNRMPHHTFRWEGIDGTQILAHMPPEGTYNSAVTPKSILTAERLFKDKGVMDEALVLFGIGDGGGGAGEDHLERLERMENLSGLPIVSQGFAQDALDRMKDNWQNLCVWRGEIYFERHQGTYTNQAQAKWFNRRMEQALGEMELAHVLAGCPFPRDRVEAIWKEMLLYQFHDILPGSSIKRVYDECFQRYASLLSEVLALRDAALFEAEQKVNTQGMTAPALVFNPLGDIRMEWVQTEIGWRYIKAQPLEVIAVDLSEAPDASALNTVSAMLDKLENDRLCVRFTQEGFVASIWDKQAQREIVPEGETACQLLMYEDGAESGTGWDFDELIYDKKPVRLSPTSIQAEIDGPVARLRQTFSFGQSTIWLTLELTSQSPLLVLRFEADWQEKGKQLRMNTPLTIQAQEALCEIQFGAKQVPTHTNTTWEMARHEVCAHTFVDVSDGNYGVALLNDSKYGYGLQRGGISINLLRSAHWPDAEADRGHHTFVCAFYPHMGTAQDALVHQLAHALNQPLVVRSVKKTSAAAQKCLFVARSDNPAAVLAAVKPAEDENGAILRIYNSAPYPVTTRLDFGASYRKAIRCDLLEQRVEAEDVWAPDTQTLYLTAYSIETLRLIN